MAPIFGEARESRHMRSKEEVQSQLNGKAHWNASDREMRDWLISKFGIDGDDAESMIREALREKALSIRKTSLFRAIVALVVAVPIFFFAWLGLQSEGRRTAAGVIFLASVGLSCVGYAGKNLHQVMTGKSDVAIDA